MARLDEAVDLCVALHHVLDQLAIREATAAGTIRTSADLVRRVDRLRKDNERFLRLKAQRL